MLKKLNTKISFAIMAAFVGVVGLSNFVHAAADADLASSTEAFKTVWTDNKSTLIGFIAIIVGFMLVAGLAKNALLWGYRFILSLFGGKKKNRRG